MVEVGGQGWFTAGGGVQAVTALGVLEENVESVLGSGEGERLTGQGLIGDEMGASLGAIVDFETGTGVVLLS